MRGKSLRKRTSVDEMRLPATMRLTATMMSSMPQRMRGVSCSPKMVTPKKTAVTGSSAPRIAVGVEPMYWMALVVQRNEMAVGKMASASRLPTDTTCPGA